MSDVFQFSGGCNKNIGIAWDANIKLVHPNDGKNNERCTPNFAREEWLTSNKPKWGITYVYWMTQLQVHYYKCDDLGG